MLKKDYNSTVFNIIVIFTINVVITILLFLILNILEYITLYNN